MKAFVSRMLGRPTAPRPTLSLQVVFSDPIAPVRETEVVHRLHHYHPSLAQAQFSRTTYSDDDPNSTDELELIGRVKWPVGGLGATAEGEQPAHRVAVVVRNQWSPPPSWMSCLGRGLTTSDAFAAQLHHTRSVAFLTYKDPRDCPTDASPLQQYAALAMVAACLAEPPTIGVAPRSMGFLNLHGRTAADPACLIGGEGRLRAAIRADGSMEVARHPEAASLFCGIAPVPGLSEQAPSPSSIAFCTGGAELMGLPNMMSYASGPAARRAILGAALYLWQEASTHGTPIGAGQCFDLSSYAPSPIRLRRPTKEERRAVSDAGLREPFFVMCPESGEWLM